MSLEITKIVWEYSRNETVAKCVLLAIADHADNNGVAWPSMNMLMRKTNIGESRLRRKLRKLEDSGELIVLKRGNGRLSTKYRLDIPKIRGVKMESLGCQNKTPQPIERCQNETPEVSQLCNPRGAIAVTPEPSYNRHRTSLPLPLRKKSQPKILSPQIQSSPDGDLGLNVAAPPIGSAAKDYRDGACAVKPEVNPGDFVADEDAKGGSAPSGHSPGVGRIGAAGENQFEPLTEPSAQMLCVERETAIAAIGRCFGRPEVSEWSKDEIQALDQILPSLTQATLYQVQKLYDLPENHRHSKYRKIMLLAALRNWTSVLDLAQAVLPKVRPMTSSVNTSHTDEIRTVKPDVISGTKPIGEGILLDTTANLRDLVPSTHVTHWFKDCFALGLTANQTLVIGHRQASSAAWIRDNYLPQIRSIALKRHRCPDVIVLIN